MKDPSQLLPVSMAVLMGGESKRFGSPKAFLSFQGKTLAGHLLGLASGIASDLFAVARTPGQLPPDARSFPLVLDQWEERGPLSGLQAALSKVQHPSLFLTGVDMPYLKREVVEGFLGLWEKSDRPGALAPRIQGRWEPLCALYSRGALKALEPGRWRSFQQFLTEGPLKVQEVSLEELAAFDPSLDCLRNFNTKEEWDWALQRSTS